MKKVIAILLVVAMLFTLIPNVFADNGCFPPCGSGFVSIVDALNSVGAEDSSYAYRCQIAEANAIEGYHGSAEQNTYMIHLLEEGRLKRPGAFDDTPSYSYSAPVYEYSAPSASVFVGRVEPVEHIIEVTSSCIVRDEPTKYSGKIGRVEVGDCFVVKEIVRNKYGNVWFRISCLGKTAFIYEANVKAHVHDYEKLGGAELSLCKCGAYCSAQNGATTINAAAAADSIFGGLEGLSEAAGALSAAGGAFLTAAGAAGWPIFLGVVSVGTMSFLIYFAVSKSGAHVYTETAELIETEDALLNKLDRDGDETYYKAAALLDGCGLLLSKDGMDIEEANSFLQTVLLPANRTYSELTQSYVASVYTFDPNDARLLGQRFSENGQSYGFGTSKDANGQYEGAHKVCYYDHYHVWNEFGKNWGTHIFFGLPRVAQVA